MTSKMMNKMIAAGITTSVLLTGLNVAQADTVTTTKTTTTVVTTVTKTDKVNSGEIKAGTTTTTTKATPVKPATKVTEPYYYYNGFTSRNADFELDKSFVTALNYGNFTLNKQTVSKKPMIQSKAIKSMVNDTAVYKTKGVITSLMFPVKNGVIKKADFLKAHAANTLMSDNTAKSGKSIATFKTKASSYSAYFDKAGFLTSIKINPAKVTYAK
ncbi:immunodominant staphylococcal antigen IsaB family protein [Macrococcus animalis]|uniref:immunodominant staphylococcal antigen IsaB family protein n=1 Tax=Macrococcus animalis TaxID=3395467 RepID=UPI0039BDE8E3